MCACVSTELDDVLGGGGEQPRLASSWHSPLLCTTADADHIHQFAARLLMLF